MTTELPPPRKLQRRGAFEEDVAGPRTALRQSSLELLANASASMDQKKEHALPRDLKRRHEWTSCHRQRHDTWCGFFHRRIPARHFDPLAKIRWRLVRRHPTSPSTIAPLPATPRSNDGEYLDSQDSAVREWRD